MFSRQSATSLNQSICLFCSRGCAAFRDSPAALTPHPFCAAVRFRSASSHCGHSALYSYMKSALCKPACNAAFRNSPAALTPHPFCAAVRFRSASSHCVLSALYIHVESALCKPACNAAFHTAVHRRTANRHSTDPDTCRRFVLIRFLAACAAASSRYPVFPRCCGLSDIPETRIPAQRHRQTSHT